MSDVKTNITRAIWSYGNEMTLQEKYNNACLNPDNMPFWLPRLAPCFPTPKTVFFPIDFDTFVWITSDDYKPNDIERLGEQLVKAIEQGFGSSVKLPLFLKGYTYSNKFVFSDCVIDSLDPYKIGKKALNIAYAAMCVGCAYQTGFAIREFIDPDCSLPKIYCGMPLHTEFRSFYDFDKRKVLAVYPYWEKKTMLTGLYGFDKDVFAKYADILEGKFAGSVIEVTQLAERQLRLVEGLHGIWSIDFMKDVSGKVWLIDAAIGCQSYYYERLGIE